MNVWDRLPAYLRIKKELIDEIMTGTRAVHSRLPSEDELCKRFNVSRGTVRQALSELSNDGYIYKVHGKGTFVKAHEYEHSIDTSRFVSFLDDLIEKGVQPSVEVLGVCREKPSECVASYLDVSSEEESVFTVRRRRAVGEKIIMYSENHLPCYIYPNMLDDGNDYISLYATLNLKQNIRVDKGMRMMQAMGAPAHIARIMEIKPGAPVMYVQQIVYDKQDRCVDCADIWLRSEYFRFTVSMRRRQQ